MKWPSFLRSQRSSYIADAEQLAVLVEDFQSRNESVPDELAARLLAVVNNGRLPNDLLMRLKAVSERGLEKSFQDYEELVSNATKPVDLSRVAQQFRAEHAGVDLGPMVEFAFARIEACQGTVSLAEGIFAVAMLNVGDGRDGPELRYLKERQRRGYPSLYSNEEHIEWSAVPGFYEKQLQIRHNNVLFPVGKRRVSFHDVWIAHLLDREESADFLEQWQSFSESTPDRVVISGVVDVLQALCALLEKAVLLSGEMAGIVGPLQEAYRQTLARAYEEVKDSPEITAQFQSVERLQGEAAKVLYHPGCQRVRRISDEADILPTILSEDDESFRLIVERLLGPDIASVQNDVRKLMNESPQARELLERQPAKLALLGIIQ
jgi:hypothetical protein